MRAQRGIRQVVDQLDPERLAGSDAQGGSHDTRVAVAGEGASLVGVIEQFHDAHRGREIVIHVAAVAGIGAGDEIGRTTSSIRRRGCCDCIVVTSSKKKGTHQVKNEGEVKHDCVLMDGWMDGVGEMSMIDGFV